MASAWLPLATVKGHEVSTYEWFLPILGQRFGWLALDVEEERPPHSGEELDEVLTEVAPLVAALIAERSWGGVRVLLPQGFAPKLPGARQRPLVLFHLKGERLAEAAGRRRALDEGLHQAQDGTPRVVAAAEADYDVWKVAFRAFCATQDMEQPHLDEAKVRGICDYFQDAEAGRACFLILGADGSAEGMMHLATHPAPVAGAIAFMNDLWVDSSRHRGGLGSTLVSTAAAWAQDAGLLELRWFCLVHNERAKAFYHAIGAEVLADNVWQL